MRSIGAHFKYFTQHIDCNCSGCKGFTLIEVVAALFLMAILTAIFGMGLVMAVQSHDFSRTNVHVAQKAELVMNRMSRELMELTDIIAVSGSGDDPFIIYERLTPETPITATRFGLHHNSSANTILLYTDLDSGVSRLDSSVADQGDVLIDGVQSLTLTYYQGIPTWSFGADIQRLSTIDLNLDLERADRTGQTENFNIRIHLRNTNNFGGAAPTTNPASRDDYSCFIKLLIGNST